MTPDLGFAHRWVPADLAPPTPGAPTLLLLHGTGGNEDDLLPLGRRLAPGAALLSPRGKVLEQGMPRFFRRLAEGVFDVEDLHARTHELAAWVEHARAEYGIDPAGLVAVGFSNGANIAASLLLLHPGLLRGAVLLAAMVPQLDLPRDGPGGVDADVSAADLTGTGVFIGAGRADPIAPPAQAEALAALLADRGAAVELHWHPGGHGVDASTVAAATTWLGGVSGGGR